MAPATTRLTIAAADAVESLIERLRLPEPAFPPVRRLGVFHASTPDHLAILLEHALHTNPALRVGVSSWLPDATRDLPEWPVLAREHDLHPSPPEAADLAILLHSPRSGAGPAQEKRIKTQFARSRAARKLVLDADGSAWRGGMAARAIRAGLRRAAGVLLPRRDALEQALLRESLLADPGYDPAESPPRPADPAADGWRRLLDRPAPLEQDPATGLVLRRLDALKPDPRLYEEDYHGRRYIDHRRDWEQELREWQALRWANLRSLGLRPPAEGGPRPRALDAGCGSGSFAHLLQQLGFEVDAFDVSRSAIEHAKARMPGIHFTAAGFEEIELPEGSYDLVVLSHVLEHAEDDGALLAMLRPALAPGGLLYVEVPWMDLGPLAARPGWHRQRDHWREYGKRALWARMRASGFEVLAHKDSWAGGEGEPYQFLLARAAGG